MIALLAPEVVFGSALLEWADSCDELKNKLSEFGTTIGQYVAHNYQGMIRPATGQKHMQCWQQ